LRVCRTKSIAAWLTFKSGRRADRSMREGRRLEQRAHAAGAFADQPRERGVVIDGLDLERGRALLDAEAAQELRLRDRPETLRAHCFHRLAERLEINMGGEVERAGRVQRIGVSVL